MKDKIYRSVPVNKTAALVASRGEHYNPNKTTQSSFSKLPIPVRPVPENTAKNGDDITGEIFGRLTVVGLAKYKKGRWVCRCSCGYYVLRSSKAIRNPENYADRCDLCIDLSHLKRDEVFRRTGKRTDLRFF